MSNERRVPGAIAVAILTGRPEIVEAFRRDIREDLTPQLAEAVVELAVEVVKMRQELFAEAERIEQLLEQHRDGAFGVIRSAEKAIVRIDAWRKGEDADAAEEDFRTHFTRRR